MTIAILKKEPGQTIPRPFNRADNAAEMMEILECYARHAGRHAPVDGSYDVAEKMRTANMDTEKPVLEIPGATFYAFTEKLY